MFELTKMPLSVATAHESTSIRTFVHIITDKSGWSQPGVLGWPIGILEFWRTANEVGMFTSLTFANLWWAGSMRTLYTLLKAPEPQYALCLSKLASS